MAKQVTEPNLYHSFVGCENGDILSIVNVPAADPSDRKI